MNNINVPFIPDLEKMSPEVLNETLNKNGKKEFIENVNWASFPYKPEVSFNIAASEKYLFVKFFVKGFGLKAEFANTNEPVWQDSCVEVFIEDKNGKGYRNFEINCIGTLLSSHQEAKGKNVKRITEEEANKIIRYSSLKKESFSEKEGEHEWELIVGIPFSYLEYEKRPEKLRANFYKCADGSKWPHYVSWAPILTPAPDFHRPEFFGNLELEAPPMI